MSKADVYSGGGWTTFNVWDRDEDQPGSSLLNSKAPEKDPKFHRSTLWNLQLLPLFPPPRIPPEAEWEGGMEQEARSMLKEQALSWDAQRVAEPWEPLQTTTQPQPCTSGMLRCHSAPEQAGMGEVEKWH